MNQSVLPLRSSHPTTRRARATARGLALLVAVALCGCAPRDSGFVFSGRIEADNAHIGSKIGGRVVAVNFIEGLPVKAGDVVVALDDAESSAQLAQAKAARDQAQAELDLLLAGARREDITRAEAVVAAGSSELDMRKKGFREEEVREAEAELVSAASDLDLAKKEFDRAETLIKTGTIDLREHDRARTSHAAMRAKYDVAQQKAALMRSGSRPEEIATAEAQLAQAKADLERLKNGARPQEIAASRAALEQAVANIYRFSSQLAEMRILAPSDATVETLDLQLGDLVKAGQAVAVLKLNRRPYVRCYLPENRLGFVKPGQTVDVTIDSFADRRFKGTVRRTASEAEFTPRNVQTTEKRAEVVFETKVDVDDEGGVLRPGMYADVHIRQSPEGK